jgi:hypothetical protein
MLVPLRFIGDQVEVVFDEPPALSKAPGCPSAIVRKTETLRVVEMIDEWKDFTRRGRFAKNMQPQHAQVASSRGSWGVGRFFFHVRVEDGRYFELYYDRAPKDALDRQGAWFLRAELARRDQ